MSTVAQINIKQKFLEPFISNDITKSLFRTNALKVLNEIDFPNVKDEDWKYTRTNKITKNTYKIVKSKTAQISDYLTENSCVFINGFYNPEFSSNEIDFYSSLNNNITPVKFFKTNKNIFTAINAAFFTDGFYLNSKKYSGKKIRIIHYNSYNAIANLHHFIHIEKNTNVELEFVFLSDENINLTNIITQILIEENAKLTLNILQNESQNTSQINLIHTLQEQNSQFNINTFSLGGELIRNDLNIYVNGKNCQTNLNGIYIAGNTQHIDNHTLVDHLMPHCQSNETYKGVMSGKSTGVFNGKIYVRPDAQKINAYQNNANILLSDEASINTKPELEIYADDVKCSHGSTTGQLDEEALFYLRSRGIGEEQAKKIMVHAFIAEVTENIKNDPFQSLVQQIIEHKLSTL